MKRLYGAGLLLLSVLLAAGCAGGPSGTAGTQAPTAPALSAAPTGGAERPPSVLIVDPAFDGGVAAGNVTVSVQVTGFVLVPPGAPTRPGTGHLVYYRDVTPQTAPDGSALTAPGTYVTTSGTTYTWEGIAPGTHTFAVQLVNGDDMPLDPPAIDAVDVTAVSSEMIRAG